MLRTFTLSSGRWKELERIGDSFQVGFEGGKIGEGCQKGREVKEAWNSKPETEVD
jgi:hypothetical protein